MLAAHPNMVPLAGRRVDSDPLGALEWLVSLGFSVDDAVSLWQSMLAYTVGFSVLSSGHAAMDTYDLSQAVADRMVQWRDETVARTLRMILDSYDALRVPPADSV
jgi:hypothetical protein